jgi:hypothetical protein
MAKKNMSMSILPGSMDSECVELCNAINMIPGIRTIESCCGHGNSNFLVFLKVDGALGLENLPELLYWLDPCHVGFRWWCKVKTDCGMSPATFYIESVVQGEEAYKQAKEIADLIVMNLKIKK